MAPMAAPGAVFQLGLPTGSRSGAPRAQLPEITPSQRGFGRWSQKMQLSLAPCQARVDLAVDTPAFFLIAYGHIVAARGGPTGMARGHGATA